VGGDGLVHHGPGADDAVFADVGGVQDRHPGAQPAVGAHAERAAGLHAGLLGKGRGVAVVVFPAAEQVGIGPDDRTPAQGEVVGGENRAVGGDVDAGLDIDVAVLAVDDGVAADIDIVPQGDAAVVGTLGVDHAVVVDDDVAAQGDLAQVAEGDIAADEHRPAGGAEQARIGAAAQEKARRAGQAAQQAGEQFGDYQAHKAGAAVVEFPVFTESRAGAFLDGGADLHSFSTWPGHW